MLLLYWIWLWTGLFSHKMALEAGAQVPPLPHHLTRWESQPVQPGAETTVSVNQGCSPSQSSNVRTPPGDGSSQAWLYTGEDSAAGGQGLDANGKSEGAGEGESEQRAGRLLQPWEWLDPGSCYSGPSKHCLKTGFHSVSSHSPKVQRFKQT